MDEASIPPTGGATVTKTSKEQILLRYMLLAILVVLLVSVTWLWQQRKINDLKTQVTNLSKVSVAHTSQNTVIACGRTGGTINYNVVVQEVDMTKRLITFEQQNPSAYDRPIQRLYCKDVLVVDNDGKTLSIDELKPDDITNIYSDNNYILKIEVLR